jgi:ATP-binding protein involved in chromosome partitioning
VLVTFASGKGGVGKTTSAIAFAAALVARSPVLLDLDSGADATWSLGYDFGDGAVDVLEGRLSLQDALLPTDEGFAIVSASPILVRLESRSVEVLAARLREISRGRLVLADTAPGFAPIVTRAAIAAADVVVVPFVPEPTSERRARHVLEVVDALGVKPRVFMLATSVDTRGPARYLRLLTGAIIKQAQASGVPLLGEIPRAVAVPESSNVGKSVLAFAPTSPASKAYQAAAKELSTILR